MLDSINQKFGKLQVIQKHGVNNRGEILWLCQCDCGNKHIAKSRNLKIGKVQSCGCIKTGTKFKDLSGQKFHRLLVLKLFGKDKWRTYIYLCRCDCGNLTKVRQRALITGQHKSCGCYSLSLKQRRGVDNPQYDHSKSIEDRIDRRHLEGYRFWRDEVKRLANYICMACKQKASGKLVSHHIESYHNNPLLRTDINNGACLCKICHDAFHKQYGRFKNTRLQFEDFIKCRNMS